MADRPLTSNFSGARPVQRTPSMTKPRTTTNASPLPTTIWLPGPHDAEPSPVAPSVLPAWALDKIRAEFTYCPGRPHAPLLCLTIGDTEPGMDARTPCAVADATCDDTYTSLRSKPVILGELHPATLPATAVHSRYGSDDLAPSANPGPASSTAPTASCPATACSSPTPAPPGSATCSTW
ncbi:hypothetical protein HEP87_10955 [Streptomyces sp. S1D4-11]|nr:hypothetical protein [Streptomyces sp. S1D4-11]